MVPQPHDALLRAIFGHPAEAAAELRSLLPIRVTAALDLDRLARQDTSWVDDKLRGSAADLLFRAPLRDGTGDGFVLFLMEHQSRPDERLPMRLLRYATRIWERYEAEAPSAPHPLIVPVLIHQGPRPWPWSTRFSDRCAGDAALRESLVPWLYDFEFVLDDLGAQSDEELLGRAMSAIGRLTLIALRNGRIGGELAEHFARFLRALHDDLRGPSVVQELSQLVSYVLAVGEGEPRQVRAILAAALPDEQRSDVMTTADMLRAEGRAEGLVEGWRASVLGLVEIRFGAISTEARERIGAADLAQLRRWQQRVLSAPDERALFAEQMRLAADPRAAVVSAPASSPRAAGS